MSSPKTASQEPHTEVVEMMEEIAAIAASAGRGCRDTYIAAAFVCGVPMTEIGEQIGLTRERIRQILNGFGLTSGEGGYLIQRSLHQLSSLQEQERHKDHRCRQLFGCNYATFKAINGDLPLRDRASPCYYYRQIRANARSRGIEFTLSLSEWWGCWAASGMSNERAGPERYGMTRIDFRKGFVAENVRICTSGEAASAYQRQVMSRGQHALLHGRQA